LTLRKTLHMHYGQPPRSGAGPPIDMAFSAKSNIEPIL
jgi:hypothetical protein